MENNLQENVVIYDWLSFTTKQHTPEQVIETLGLSSPMLKCKKTPRKNVILWRR